MPCAVFTVKLDSDSSQMSNSACAKRAEEDFLRRQRHEHRIDAVDLHGAVDQRAVAVVVADGDGKIELGHVEGPGLVNEAASHRAKARALAKRGK